MPRKKEEPGDPLSPFEWGALSLIFSKPDIKYRDIAYAFHMEPKDARELVSRARIRFAEMNGIAPEALDLEANKGKHRPQLIEGELEQLRAYFTNERERMLRDFPHLSKADRFSSKSEEPEREKFVEPDSSEVIQSHWTKDIEQRRQGSNKRQR